MMQQIPEERAWKDFLNGCFICKDTIFGKMLQNRKRNIKQQKK